MILEVHLQMRVCCSREDMSTSTRIAPEPIGKWHLATQFCPVGSLILHERGTILANRECELCYLKVSSICHEVHTVFRDIPDR